MQIWRDETADRLPLDAADNEIYDRLVHRIYARVPDADALLRHHRDAIDASTSVVLTDPDTLIERIELIDAWEMPFDHTAMARVAWKRMGTKDPTFATVRVEVRRAAPTLRPPFYDGCSR